MRANIDELIDALKHLLDNAYRFTPTNGTITVFSEIKGDYLWVNIHDTGPGISAENLPHIFETFWRKDEAHQTPGFGLGLPIAQRIVELFGGRIEVESKLGNGSTFSIVMPLASKVVRVR